MSFLSPGANLHRGFNLLFGDAGGAGGPHACPMGPLWSATVAAPADRYSGLARIGDRYIASGRGRSGATPTNTMFSTDKGATWQAGGGIPNYAQATPFSLRAGNGLLCCYIGFVGSGGSSDLGVTWTVDTPGAFFGCGALQFGGGRFVYFDNAGAFTYSSATGFAVVTRATPAQIANAIWDETAGRWVCFEANGVRTWTTPDLITYTQRGNMPRNGLAIAVNGIAQNGPNICAVYNDGTGAVLRSGDSGLTWQDSAALPFSQFGSLVYGNSVFIAARALGGQTIVSSDNGATWQAGNALTMAKNWILAFDSDNNYLAVGTSGIDDTVANIGVC